MYFLNFKQNYIYKKLTIQTKTFRTRIDRFQNRQFRFNSRIESFDDSILIFFCFGKSEQIDSSEIEIVAKGYLRGSMF